MYVKGQCFCVLVMLLYLKGTDCCQVPCLLTGDHKVDSLFRQHNLQKGQQVSQALVPSVAPFDPGLLQDV